MSLRMKVSTVRPGEAREEVCRKSESVKVHD